MSLAGDNSPSDVHAVVYTVAAGLASPFRCQGSLPAAAKCAPCKIRYRHMVNIFVSVLGIAPVVMILLCLRMALRRNLRLLALVLGLTALHETALVALPAVASAMTDFAPERGMAAVVDPSELAVTLFGEMTFVTIFWVTLWVIVKRRGRGSGGASTPDNSVHHLTALILIVIGIFIQTDNLIHPGGFAAYASELEGSLVRSTPELILAWVASVFWFPCIAVAAVIFVKGKHDRYSRLMWLGASVVLFEVVLTGFANGVRGRLITAVCLVGAVAVFKRRGKILVYLLLIIAVFLPISTVLPNGVRALAYQVAAAKGSSMEVLTQLPELFGDEADRFGISAFFTEAMWRVQGPRNSTILYRLYDTGNAAGGAPYLGALVFPVPRLIWPKKPSVGSSDGTFRGQAMYLVMALGYGFPETTMGPFLASAEAYWEAGWLGIIASAVATALLWYGILNVATRLGDTLSIAVALMFACSLLVDGVPTALMPLFSLIAFVWKALLPTLAVYLMAKWSITFLRPPRVA